MFGSKDFNRSAFINYVWGVWASGTLTPSPSALSAMTGLYQALGSAVSPAVYVIPCARFNCFVRASPPSYTVATLGMSGWLNLTQPGLSPGQKRQASLGALTPRRSAARRLQRRVSPPTFNIINRNAELNLV